MRIFYAIPSTNALLIILYVTAPIIIRLIIIIRWIDNFRNSRWLPNNYDIYTKMSVKSSNFSPNFVSSLPFISKIGIIISIYSASIVLFTTSGKFNSSNTFFKIFSELRHRQSFLILGNWYITKMNAITVKIYQKRIEWWDCMRNLHKINALKICMKYPHEIYAWYICMKNPHEIQIRQIESLHNIMKYAYGIMKYVHNIMKFNMLRQLWRSIQFPIDKKTFFNNQNILVIK